MLRIVKCGAALSLMAVLCALAGGCTSVNVKPSEKAAAPRKADCKIEVFRGHAAAKKVSRPYREVGRIEYGFFFWVGAPYTGRPMFIPWEKAIAAAKPKACRCGADALIVSEEDVTSIIIVLYHRAWIKMKAIKYTD